MTDLLADVDAAGNAFGASRRQSLLTGYMREPHDICAKYNNVATTSLIEVWIDETERRTWFLAETAASL